MKRMIDNKDYEDFKKDVEKHSSSYVVKNVVVEDEEILGIQIQNVDNDTTYNIPVGGGSGEGIPSIEISSAQIIDDYNFSFTEEQGQILFEYPPIINLVLDGYSIPLIYAYDESNKFVYSSVVFSNFDNVKSLYCQLITFNTSTLKGSIIDETFEKPKQLYQHNLWCYDSQSNVKFCLNIINDNDTAFDWTKLTQYLTDNGFLFNVGQPNTGKLILASGNSAVSNQIIIGLSRYAGSTILIKCDTQAQNTFTSQTIGSGFSIIDTIVAL